MGSSAFYISEIVFGDDGYAVVTNGSGETADPEGMQLCQFPAYPDLPAGAVPPQGSIKVAGQDLGGLDNSEGELALYLEPSYADPDAVAGYVQWGEIGHKREEPAVDAGVWDDGAFIDASSANSLVSEPGAHSPDDWTIQ